MSRSVFPRLSETANRTVRGGATRLGRKVRDRGEGFRLGRRTPVPYEARAQCRGHDHSGGQSIASSSVVASSHSRGSGSCSPGSWRRSDSASYCSYRSRVVLIGGVLAGGLWLGRRTGWNVRFEQAPRSSEVSRRGKARFDELAPRQHLQHYANAHSRRAHAVLETQQRKPNRSRSTAAAKRIDSTSSVRSFDVKASTNGQPSSIAPRSRSSVSWVTGAPRR